MKDSRDKGGGFTQSDYLFFNLFFILIFKCLTSLKG